MITLLRKIRKKLISQNNFTSYLLYAIGEIALVMIGILLALQVNNWNEQRKTKLLERELLQDYQEELQYNSEVVAGFNNSVLERLDFSNTLITAIDQQLPYVDSLSACYNVLTMAIRFNLSLAAFNSLQANGIDIISNKMLRKAILDLHANHFGQLEGRLNNQIDNVKDYSRPIIRSQLKSMGNRKYIPLDYNALMSDVKLWNILLTLRSNFSDLNVVHEGIQKKIREIDQLIEMELN